MQAKTNASANSVTVPTFEELWQRVQICSNDKIAWSFISKDAAKFTLKVHERRIKTWAKTCGFESIEIRTPEATWEISARKIPGIEVDWLPMLPHTPSMEKFLTVARGEIPGSLVDILGEIKNSDAVRAIIDFSTQRQVVMNQACIAHPIGDSLDNCLDFARADYWDAPDLAEFLQKCRQEGGSTVEHTYWTFDPLDLANGGTGDRMRLHGRYNFLDCGRFGLYQTGIVERVA